MTLRRSYTFVFFISIAIFTSYVIPVQAKPVQTNDQSAPLDEKIALIEKSLAPSFITTDTQRWTIQERMQHYSVPGVSIALINHGKIEWARAYGVRDVSTKAPVTADTLFQAASISKPVSASGALLLVEQGKLSLDENVNEKLVSWKLPENEFTRKTPVTLRALLTHTAGTSVTGFGGYELGQTLPTVPQILDGIKPANNDAVRVDTVPRTQWRYSGGGTTIVQQLMIDVTRQPFGQYMRDYVLQPAGMKRSAYEQPLSPERAALAASGHVNGQPVSGKWRVYPELAAAGLWSTPSDLARFAIEVQRASSSGKSRWLKQETALKMVSESSGIASTQRPWAIGFGLDPSKGNTRFEHGGSNEGFQCHLVAFVGSGRGIVVMTNGDSGTRLIEEIQRAIAHVYGWKELAPTVHKLIDLEPAALDEFVGEYKDTNGTDVSILRDGGQLVGRASGMGWDRLYPTGQKSFVSKSSQLKFQFSTGSADKNNDLSITTHEGVTRATRQNGKEFKFATVPFFLRGSMNNWNTSVPMQPQSATAYSALIELDRGEYEFKFGSEDFSSVDIGSVPSNPTVLIDQPTSLALVGANIKLSVDKKARYAFSLDVKNPLKPTLIITPK